MKWIKRLIAFFMPSAILAFIFMVAAWEIDPSKIDILARFFWGFLSCLFGVISVAAQMDSEDTNGYWI